MNNIKAWQFHWGRTCWKAIIFTIFCRQSNVAGSQAVHNNFRGKLPNNLIFIECIFGLTPFDLQGIWEICKYFCMFQPLYYHAEIFFKLFSILIYSNYPFKIHPMSVYVVGTRHLCLTPLYLFSSSYPTSSVHQCGSC